MTPNARCQNRFSWNAGGLAGCALGASLWMPATAITSVWPGIGVAISFATAFLILIGAYVIWHARQRKLAFQGLMTFIAVGSTSTLLFFVLAHLLGLSMLTSWPRGKTATPLEGAWVLLLYTELAAEFWFLNRGQPPANQVLLGRAVPRPGLATQSKIKLADLLERMEEASPDHHVIFLTDFQLGPEEPLECQCQNCAAFWAQHDQHRLRHNTLYHVGRAAPSPIEPV